MGDKYGAAALHQTPLSPCSRLPGPGMDKDTSRRSGEMFWMETFFMPRCPETGESGHCPGLGGGMGAQAVMGCLGPYGWGMAVGGWARSGHTYSDVAEVSDGLAFVGRHHDGWCYRWTPQLQVHGAVGTEVAGSC